MMYASHAIVVTTHTHTHTHTLYPLGKTVMEVNQEINNTTSQTYQFHL